MVVSTAFEELTEVLRCLETSEAEIRQVALHEQTPDTEDGIAADLTIGVPVLPGVSDSDISIEADGFDVQNQLIGVDVTVTLPVTDDEASGPPLQREYGTAERNGGSTAQSTAVPSYKDPDALRAVYDEYDTFPEMTDALGVDVTSETVRRYMVEYDIHDPTDNTPQAHALSHSNAQAKSQQKSNPDTDSSPQAGTEPASGQTGKNRHESQTTEGENSPNSTRAESDTTPTTQPDTATDETAGETDSTDELGRRSVAEMIAESDSDRTDDKLIADGLGIPRDMTVAELATVVNQSNTIHEVTQQLDMKQGNARRLLQKLNLIDFVIHRLAADQINVSHEEIARRIAAND